MTVIVEILLAMASSGPTGECDPPELGTSVSVKGSRNDGLMMATSPMRVNITPMTVRATEGGLGIVNPFLEVLSVVGRE